MGGGTQKLEVAVRFSGFGFIPFFGGGGAAIVVKEEEEEDGVVANVVNVIDMVDWVAMALGVDGDRDRFRDLMSSIGDDVDGVAELATLLDGEHTLSVGLGVLTLCAVFGESVPKRLKVEKSVVL